MFVRVDIYKYACNIQILQKTNIAVENLHFDVGNIFSFMVHFQCSYVSLLESIYQVYITGNLHANKLHANPSPTC